MPFKKGISGNPLGGPKDKIFADALRVVLKREDGKDKKTKLMHMAEKLVDHALKDGAPWAFQMIADRIDGKPAQAVEVSYDDRTSIEQFSDAELTAIMRSKLADAAVNKDVNKKPPSVNKDGNVLN